MYHYAPPLSVSSLAFTNFARQLQKKGLSKELINNHKNHYIYDLPTERKFPCESYLNFYRLASFNRNGYVRERALRYLIKYFNPQNIPFILIRLNDNVNTIRNIASNALPQLLQKENTIVLLENFPLIYNLQNQKNTQAQKAYKKIIKFLFKENKFHDDFLVINSQSRQLIADILLNTDFDQRALADWFLKDPQFIIRKKALLLHNLLSKEKLLSLLNDPSSSIRKAMLYWLNDHGTIEEKDKYYKAKLLDHSKTVRQLAQFYLKQNDYDLINFYQQAFQSGDIEASLLGLLDLNNSSFIDKASPYLDSKLAKQQIASFLYISHFQSNNLYQWALNHLANDNSKLQRHLLDYLTDYTNTELEAKLNQLLALSPTQITKRRILCLLIKFRSISSLETSLQLTLDKDIHLSNLAKHLITNRLRTLKYGIYVNQNEMQESIKAITNFLQQTTLQSLDENFVHFLKNV